MKEQIWEELRDYIESKGYSEGDAAQLLEFARTRPAALVQQAYDEVWNLSR